MKLLAYLLLCCTALAQSIEPPGLSPAQMTLGRIRLQNLHANITPGGGLYGLRLRGNDGFVTLTSPPDYRPQISTNQDGLLQLVAAGTIPGESTPRYLHESGSNPDVKDGVPIPKHSPLIQCDSVGLIGTAPWKSTNLIHDSVKYDSEQPWALRYWKPREQVMVVTFVRANEPLLSGESRTFSYALTVQ